jgi:aminomethyltransferase
LALGSIELTILIYGTAFSADLCRVFLPKLITLIISPPHRFMTVSLKTVTLNDTHRKLGAKMVPFAGYDMPVRYSSDLDEHHTVRRAVGIFDVSHMGEFRLRGPQALDLIQRVTSNDASKLADGKAQYSCLPNHDGGIVDDLLVYKLADEDYLLVVNASNIEKDWNWIQHHNTQGVEMEDISDRTSLFAVQGPKANAALQQLTDVDLSTIPYYSFVQGTLAGAPNVIISATGYTGAGGFELYIPNESAAEVWEKIMLAGQAYGIKPIGLGARDTLRLEMGYCLYGNDIDDATSPLEAGLGWITKFTKEFTNSANLKKQKDAGVSKKLVGFVMDGPGIPRGHYELVDAEGQKIGDVTSGTQSPSLSKGIGLGYVKTEFAVPGTQIFVQIRGKNLPATVSKLPLTKGTEE